MVRVGQVGGAESGQGAGGPRGSRSGRSLARHTTHPRFHDDLADYVRGVFALAGRAIEEYDDWKTRNRLLDFVDLETRALELLELPEVAGELRQRFDVLLVDEFQDTNPIQLALFLRLGELAGRVVWVGDEKQAIYGFRGSDPELVQAVTAQVADPSTQQTLKVVVEEPACLGPADLGGVCTRFGRRRDSSGTGCARGQA